MVGPPYHALDLMLSKTFPVGDRWKAEFRAEAFNVTNTPYNTNIGSGTTHQSFSANNLVLTPTPGFGVGTASAGYPDGTNVRRAQVSLRFVF